MPPALVTESENESNEEEIAPRTKEDEEVVDANAGDGEGGEEEEDDDDDPEEYIVEQILDHDLNFDDGEPRYEISWQGYPKKKDRTWEVEANLEGARELLEEYWATIGGKPVPKSKGSSTKKRGRQSLGNSETPNTASKKQKISRGGRKSTGSAKSKELPELPSDAADVEDDWDPPKVAAGSWENDVLQVDTIEGDNDDKDRWAYLVWAAKDANGAWRRSRAKLETCYLACPQRMLKFYENHLVFADSRDAKKKVNGEL